MAGCTCPGTLQVHTNCPWLGHHCHGQGAGSTGRSAPSVLAAAQPSKWSEAQYGTCGGTSGTAAQALPPPQEAAASRVTHSAPTLPARSLRRMAPCPLTECLGPSQLHSPGRSPANVLARRQGSRGSSLPTTWETQPEFWLLAWPSCCEIDR